MLQWQRFKVAHLPRLVFLFSLRRPLPFPPGQCCVRCKEASLVRPLLLPRFPAVARTLSVYTAELSLAPAEAPPLSVPAVAAPANAPDSGPQSFTTAFAAPSDACWGLTNIHNRHCRALKYACCVPRLYLSPRPPSLQMRLSMPNFQLSFKQR